MKSLKMIIITATVVVTLTSWAFSQPSTFTYQGSLTDAGSPANGSFQMQFRLFDNTAGGSQIGSTLADVPVTAANGIFSVKLDFGANAVSGAGRWLEIAVRRNAGDAYTTLNPREQITSSPYAVRTISATQADGLSAGCVGCVQNSHINSVDGAKVTGTVANAANAQNATTATNATNAMNFTGTLNGDVTGTQPATTVTKLRSVILPAPAAADNGKVLKYKNNGVDPITYEWAVDNTSTGGGVAAVTASGPLASTGGSNPNISLTGTVATTNGGTGLTSAGVSGNFLRSTGSAWTSSTLAVGDIPDLGSMYLRNSTDLQTGNFNISGNGYVGGRVGIGTTVANTRLTLGAGPQWTSNGWSATMNMPNVSAFGWEANASGQRFGIGQTQGGLVFFRTNSGFGNVASPANYDFVIDDSGRIGIGTSTPGSGLELRGPGLGAQQRITDPASGNSLVLQGGTGSNMKVSGYHYGTGQAVPLYLSVDGGNTVLNSEGGNVLQPGAGFGVPKAMVLVLANGVIARCYNGITGATTNNCGFTATTTVGLYAVNFGFDVTQRFLSLSIFGALSQIGGTMALGPSLGRVDVRTFLTYQSGSFTPSDFFLIVY